jgi:hypothetical protein
VLGDDRGKKPMEGPLRTIDLGTWGKGEGEHQCYRRHSLAVSQIFGPPRYIFTWLEDVPPTLARAIPTPHFFYCSKNGIAKPCAHRSRPQTPPPAPLASRRRVTFEEDDSQPETDYEAMNVTYEYKRPWLDAVPRNRRTPRGIQAEYLSPKKECPLAVETTSSDNE